MIGAGIHINAVGGDCPGKTELHHDILSRADTFVEYTPQTRIEGEIQQMPPEYPVTEMWKVVTGQATGRRDARQITLFDSVGFAIEDFSALRYVRGKLAGTGLYQDLDMIADPDEPRDLFGMLQRSRKIKGRNKPLPRPLFTTSVQAERVSHRQVFAQNATTKKGTRISSDPFLFFLPDGKPVGAETGPGIVSALSGLLPVYSILKIWRHL